MKNYEAPEAIVVEFKDADLLKQSPVKLIALESGFPGEIDW